MTDSVYWIWFQLVFGIGTRRAELFMEYFAHPKEIYEGIKSGGRASAMLEPDELSASGPSLELAAQIHRRTVAKGCEVLTPDMAAYPKLLNGVYSKPAVLYVKGDLGCLDGTLAIAMVGSRKHSEYGREAAAHFAGDLAREGAVIVSGLAPGIDTESHLAALAAGGKTVGVLGCGLDVDYPRDSRELKTAVSQNGAVVTEYPLGTEPYQGNFPMRNRVISGMSHGVLVVEAGVRSGSLITARLAREQGRDVFAVPGSVFVVGEQGTHKLIKEGARLADSAGDILGQYTGLIRKKTRTGSAVVVKGKRKPIANDDPANQLAGKKAAAQSAPQEPAAPASLPDGTSEVTARVYAAFATATDKMTVDELAAKTGAAAGELLAALTELEIYGLIICHPGRRFGRN